MYDNQLYYFSGFLCLLFFLLKKDFLTAYRKILTNPNREVFLAKRYFREIKKIQNFLFLYLNYIRKMRRRNSFCLPNFTKGRIHSFLIETS